MVSENNAVREGGVPQFKSRCQKFQLFLPGWRQIFHSETRCCLCESAILIACRQLGDNPRFSKYEGWNFNSGNYLFTTDTK